MTVARALPEIAESDIQQAHNGLLDLTEQHLRLVLELGMESQLRARLARLLPAETSPPPSPAEQPVSALTLTRMLTVLGFLDRFKLKRVEHEALASVRAAIQAALSAATRSAP